MISFTTKEFSLDAEVMLQEDVRESKIYDTDRRVSRTATLDGSVALDDAGYADGDRTFTVVFPRISKTNFSALRTIQSLYSTHRCATPDGIFEGAIESIVFSDGDASVTFLVSSKLNQ